MTFFRAFSERFFGAILGGLGVVLGAFSAHGGLHDLLVANGRLEIWDTGLRYQWFHALALLAVSREEKDAAMPAFAWFWVVGVVCFTGSLYLLSVVPEAKWAGPVTPFGGLLLIVGWVLLGLRSRPKWKG